MFLLVHKPTWFTSFDVIKKLKRLYRGEKIGHAGTLDPMATWLLIVAIGKDTKKIKHFVWLDKTYTATIDFSKRSDTRDLDYREEFEQLDVHTLQQPSLDHIRRSLDSIIWYHPLPLTPFSAKKWKWKKLYEYARAGEPVFINIDMQLIEYEILDYSFPELTIQLRVGSGTYIRSIAHRLGEQCWLGGILTQLHRSSISTYHL